MGLLLDMAIIESFGPFFIILEDQYWIYFSPKLVGSSKIKDEVKKLYIIYNICHVRLFLNISYRNDL